MKKLIALLLTLVMIVSLAPAASAANGCGCSDAQTAADRLYELGLFQGTGTDAAGNPVYDLDRAPTRAEAVTMLVRLLGKEAEAQFGTWTTPFTDVADWAKPYVGCAYAGGLTDGTGAKTFGGSEKVTAAQYITLVLRALGYRSGEDFAWDRAWELSDKLGITDGRYGAATNGSFTRGDVALVSYAALSASLRDGTGTLRDTAAPACARTKETYMARKLSDAEIAALKDADLDTLRSKLSTVGDVLAFLDAFGAKMFSTRDRFLSLLPEKALADLRSGMSGTEVYTCLTAFLLSDDYVDLRYVLAAVTENSVPWMLSAVGFPVSGGHLILTPADYSSTKDNNYCSLAGLGEVTVSSLAGLQKSLVPLKVGRGSVITSIYLAPADQSDLCFGCDGTEFFLQSGKAALVYRASDAEIAAAEETGRRSRAAQDWTDMTANWSSYGLPSSVAPTMTQAQAAALYGKDIDTVAAAVRTVGDCICYYAAAGFRAQGGDLQTPDESGLEWHYNYAPAQVLAHNYGCCGAISGLTARLLQGDYDTTGIIGITFKTGEGGGHVINYVKNGGEYYVFDMINLVSTGFEQRGFQFTKSSSLQTAASAWSAASPWTEKLMYAYQSFDGDAPVGWDGTNVSKLPLEYKSSAVVLMETPAEGYTYVWVTIGSDVWRIINSVRTGG